MTTLQEALDRNIDRLVPVYAPEACWPLFAGFPGSFRVDCWLLDADDVEQAADVCEDLADASSDPVLRVDWMHVASELRHRAARQRVVDERRARTRYDGPGPMLPVDYDVSERDSVVPCPDCSAWWAEFVRDPERPDCLILREWHAPDCPGFDAPRWPQRRTPRPWPQWTAEYSEHLRQIGLGRAEPDEPEPTT